MFVVETFIADNYQSVDNYQSIKEIVQFTTGYKNLFVKQNQINSSNPSNAELKC